MVFLFLFTFFVIYEAKCNVLPPPPCVSISPLHHVILFCPCDIRTVAGDPDIDISRYFLERAHRALILKVSLPGEAFIQRKGSLSRKYGISLVMNIVEHFSNDTVEHFCTESQRFLEAKPSFPPPPCLMAW